MNRFLSILVAVAGVSICPSCSMRGVEVSVRSDRSSQFSEVVALFDGEIEKMLQWDGIAFESGDWVRLGTSGSTIIYDGSAEFVEYVRMWVNAINRDDRALWILGEYHRTKECFGHLPTVCLDEAEDQSAKQENQ